MATPTTTTPAVYHALKSLRRTPASVFRKNASARARLEIRPDKSTIWARRAIGTQKKAIMKRLLTGRQKPLGQLPYPELYETTTPAVVSSLPGVITPRPIPRGWSPLTRVVDHDEEGAALTPCDEKTCDVFLAQERPRADTLFIHVVPRMINPDLILPSFDEFQERFLTAYTELLVALTDLELPGAEALIATMFLVQDGWSIARLKEWLAYPIAMAIDHDFRTVGENLSLDPLFPIEVQREILNQTRAGVTFAASFLQIKRAMPLMPDEEVDKSYAKHLEMLCTEVKDHPETHQVARTAAILVKIMFPKGVDFDKLNPPKYASRSAVYTGVRFLGTRASNGGLGEQQTYSSNFNHIEVHPGVVLPLGCWTYPRRGIQPFWKISGRDLSPRGQTWSMSAATFPCDVLSDVLDLTEDFPNPTAQVVAVADAMKARIITKGPLEHNLLRPLQKKILARISSFPIFCLTKKWVEVSDLPFFPLRTGEYINCADFAAATDGMFTSITRSMIEQLLTQSPDPETAYGSWVYRNAVPSLINNRLSYPNANKGPRIVLKQVRGQLMGSLLSFPLLCIANAACWILAQRIPGRPDEEFERDIRTLFKTNQNRCRINGDDLVAIDNKRSLKAHSDLVPALGCKLSIGKSFHSRKYCVINSQVFDEEGQLPVFNTGCSFLRSAKRLSEYEDIRTATGLGTRIREAVTRSCRPTATLKSILAREPILRNAALFVPPPFGIGLPPTLFPDWEPKPQELAVIMSLSLGRKTPMRTLETPAERELREVLLSMGAFQRPGVVDHPIVSKLREEISVRHPLRFSKQESDPTIPFAELGELAVAWDHEPKHWWQLASELTPLKYGWEVPETCAIRINRRTFVNTIKDEFEKREFVFNCNEKVPEFSMFRPIKDIENFSWSKGGNGPPPYENMTAESSTIQRHEK
jgi:hypothetical protein